MTDDDNDLDIDLRITVPDSNNDNVLRNKYKEEIELE